MATYCEICKTDFDDKRTCGCAVVSVELTADEAHAFAQFLKRTVLDDYKAKCSPASAGGEEPYTMQTAGGKIRAALAAAGFNAR